MAHPTAPESTPLHVPLPLLLLDGVGHEPLLGALRAEDVLVVGDEALADHGGLAGGAEEAVVVPVPALERDEARPADAWRVERAILGFRNVSNGMAHIVDQTLQSRVKLLQ